MVGQSWWGDGEKADAKSFGDGADGGAIRVASWNADADDRRCSDEERQAGQGGARRNGAGSGRAGVAEYEERRTAWPGRSILPWAPGRRDDRILRVSPVARPRPDRVHEAP